MYRIVGMKYNKSDKISSIDLYWEEEDIQRRNRRSTWKTVTFSQFKELASDGFVASVRFLRSSNSFEITNPYFSWSYIRAYNYYGEVVREGNDVLIWCNLKKYKVYVPSDGKVYDENSYKDINSLLTNKLINIPTQCYGALDKRLKLLEYMQSDSYKAREANDISILMGDAKYKVTGDIQYGKLRAHEIGTNYPRIEVEKDVSSVDFTISDSNRLRELDLTNCELYACNIDIHGSHDLTIKLGNILQKYSVHLNNYTGSINVVFCGNVYKTQSGYYNSRILIDDSQIQKLSVSGDKSVGYNLEINGSTICEPLSISGAKSAELKRSSLNDSYFEISSYLTMKSCSGQHCMKVSGLNTFAAADCELTSLELDTDEALTLQCLNHFTNLKNVSIKCKELSVSRVGSLPIGCDCPVLDNLNIQTEHGFKTLDDIERYTKNYSGFFGKTTRNIPNVTFNQFSGDVAFKALYGEEAVVYRSIDKFDILNLEKVNSLSFDTGYISKAIVLRGINTEKASNLIKSNNNDEFTTLLKTGILDIPAEINGIEIFEVDNFKALGIHTLKLNADIGILELPGLKIQNSKYVTNLGGGAFQDNKDIVEFECGDKLPSIPSYAFFNCSNLERLVLNERLRSISVAALYGCSKIGISGNYDRENLKINPLFRFRSKDIHNLKIRSISDYEDEINEVGYVYLYNNARLTCLGILVAMKEFIYGYGGAFEEYRDSINKIIASVVKNATASSLVKAEHRAYKLIAVEMRKGHSEAELLDICKKCLKSLKEGNSHYRYLTSIYKPFMRLNMDKVNAVTSLDTLLNI